MISLLTDFGRVDTYVGQVKAAALRVAKDLTFVDLTHQVPPQDVRTGAFLLSQAVEIFPPGSVHLAVVDPGVGSERRAVAVRTGRGDLLVGPDNGLLAPAAARLGGAAEVVTLEAAKLSGPFRSTTFHGRDLFAPAAARLATGEPPTALGEVTRPLAEPFVLPTAQVEDGYIKGEVLHVDTYGNLVTNVPAELLPSRFLVRVGEAEVHGPHPHYQAVLPGELLALVGSAGLLEISARETSASLRTQARRGDVLVIERA